MQLLALGANSFSQNLVVNPGFESWETTTKPTGWTTAQYCLQEAVNNNSGIYSCRHSGGSTAKWLGQKILINPGKQYHFSFYYRTEVIGTGNGCRIWSNWIDAGDIDINDPLTKPILQSTTNYLKSDVWKQFSVDITSPANAKYFYLEVRTYPNSITLWDDFLFEESVPTSTYEEKISDIKIYPNPAQDFLNISNIDDLKHIEIQNLTGSTVWSSDFTLEKDATIPISGLKEGLYIICFRTSNKLIIKKFIKK